jgi:hypothetical protein
MIASSLFSLMLRFGLLDTQASTWIRLRSIALKNASEKAV